VKLSTAFVNLTAHVDFTLRAILTDLRLRVGKHLFQNLRGVLEARSVSEEGDLEGVPHVQTLNQGISLFTWDLYQPFCEIRSHSM
jgi:hypothetical protein